MIIITKMFTAESAEHEFKFQDALVAHEHIIELMMASYDKSSCSIILCQSAAAACQRDRLREPWQQKTTQVTAHGAELLIGGVELSKRTHLLKLLPVADSRVWIVGIQLVGYEAVALLHSPAAPLLVQPPHVGVLLTHPGDGPLGFLYIHTCTDMHETADGVCATWSHAQASTTQQTTMATTTECGCHT